MSQSRKFLCCQSRIDTCGVYVCVFVFFLQVNLASLIDHSGSECLNESDDHPFTNCLKTNAKYLESDCDPQLIIVLAFVQSVKLHTMQIIAPTDGESPADSCVDFYTHVNRHYVENMWIPFLMMLRSENYKNHISNRHTICDEILFST